MQYQYLEVGDDRQRSVHEGVVNILAFTFNGKLQGLHDASSYHLLNYSL